MKKAKVKFRYDDSFGLANKSAVAVGKSRKVDNHSNIYNPIFNQKHKEANDQLKGLGYTIHLSSDNSGISNKSAVAVGTSRIIFTYWKMAPTNQGLKKRKLMGNKRRKPKLSFDMTIALDWLINLLLQ